MRRVLFLAYYFPPLGGAGVQRSVSFVRYLPEFGYQTTVVTGPKDTSVAWAPADTTLGRNIATSTEIRRLPGPEPGRGTGWGRRAERWLGRESAFSRWWVDGVTKTGYEAAEQVDVIYASMSPFETGTAAMTLSEKLGKPWVADLRDPWALDEWLIYPTAAHRRLELMKMRSVLASADAIIMNTPEATLQVRRRFPELGDKTTVTIPNGFESSDFQGTPPERHDEHFRIVHTGYAHTESGVRHHKLRVLRRLLGGATKGLNPLARSHVYLLEAVEQLVAARPELRSRVEIHLAGVIPKKDQEAIRSELVRRHGYLPHDEAIALIRSADLLFLPMHDLAPGVRASAVPGKTYEYLASGRPILAAVPDGDARDLLARAGTAFLCRPTEVGCMRAVIEGEIDRAMERRGPAVADLDLIRLFERRELTRDLAAAFDRAIAPSPSARAGARASAG